MTNNGIIEDIFRKWSYKNSKTDITSEGIEIYHLKEQLKEEIRFYLMDRERYNTGLYRFLFGDSELIHGA